jgi:ribosome maturation factor RimP
MQYPGSLSPVAQELDELFSLERIHLVEAKVGTGSRIPLIKLLVDREDRFITIEDCVILSSRIEEILNRTDYFPRGYRLEVSSPGMSRHLKEPWEFRKYLDRKILLHYIDQGQPKDIEGYLVEIGALHLVLKNGESEVSVPFDALDYGKAVIDWHRPKGRSD